MQRICFPFGVRIGWKNNLWATNVTLSLTFWLLKVQYADFGKARAGRTRAGPFRTLLGINRKTSVTVVPAKVYVADGEDEWTNGFVLTDCAQLTTGTVQSVFSVARSSFFVRPYLPTTLSCRPVFAGLLATDIAPSRWEQTRFVRRMHKWFMLSSKKAKNEAAKVESTKAFTQSRSRATFEALCDSNILNLLLIAGQGEP